MPWVTTVAEPEMLDLKDVLAAAAAAELLL